MKKLVSILLTLALVVTLIPASLGTAVSTAFAASANHFVFPNEQYSPTSARITNSERVTLEGSLNGVNGNSISYSVYKLNKNPDPTATDKYLVDQNDKREGQTANIMINGSKIQLYNLQLYPGLNQVTFKGLQGMSDVYDSIFIEYRNGPTMYDMSVSLDGNVYNLKEDESTIVYSDASQGKKSVNVSISGKAPNADKVQIEVNGRSWSFGVSKSNDWTFFASPIAIEQGRNLVKIKVFNGTQSVETTREVAFFNGDVTFHDVHMKETGGTTKYDLSQSPTITASTDGVIYGRVLIPYDATKAKPTSVGVAYEMIETGSGNKTNGNATNVVEVSSNPKFVEYSFEISGAVKKNERTNLTLTSTNYALSTPSLQSMSGFSVLLKDANQPYIYAANYLSGYNNTMTPGEAVALQGGKLDGAQLFSMPAAIQFLVPNGSKPRISIESVTDALGKKQNPNTYHLNPTIVAEDVTVQNINGVPTSMSRVVYLIDKLPSTGKQTIVFRLDGSTETYTATVTLLYGPYVKYDGAFDGQKIYTDTTDANRQDQVMKELQDLAGQIYNIANEGELKYKGPDQTVFFSINNTTLELAEGATKSQFKIVNQKDAFNALYMGDNKIKFVFRSQKSHYENTITVTLIPTNLPVIPAPETDGIYPYSTTYPDPKPNDPRFEKKGGVYLTREAKMNVYGTFDFVDLGKNKAEIEGKLTSLRGSGTTKNELQNYKLVIQSPVLKNDKNPLGKIEWTLENMFTDKNGDTYNSSAVVNGISVYYDNDKQYFSFIIKGISLPGDGTPVAMNMTVFNSGEGGPRATYRLEVVPVDVPYTILKPALEKRVVNQNFVEVIIDSPGAEKVVINKIPAEKIIYYPSYDKTQKPYENAYRAFVVGLKANKDNKIEIAISRGKDTFKNTITVKYVPTSIPGAQYMEPMKKTHKVFEGIVNLTFEKGANLVRRDYNVPQNFKNQVFSGHNLLFAIANSFDGEVDRREFEYQPANYDLAKIEAKNIFEASFPERFIKAGPVIWMDPGQADDIKTESVYDPIKYGVEPYQYPGSPIEMFYKRDLRNELIMSKPGKLTLSYDKNVTDDGGRTVSVFRFDSELQQWENIGGVVDSKKHTVTVPITRFGYYVVGKMSYSYHDVVQHPYARDFIETIFAKGVMNPFDPFSMFGTDMYVSRGEFTRMIVRAKEMPLNYDGKKHFNDVVVPAADKMNTINVNQLWDFRYVETAARDGIVRGVSPNEFGGDYSIIRQDAAVMLAKALNMKLETKRDKVRKDLLKYFQDADKIDYYAQPAVLAIAKKGFITGVPIDPSDPKKGYVFQPSANMLRGDAALIMARAMIDLKKLPKM